MPASDRAAVGGTRARAIRVAQILTAPAAVIAAGTLLLVEGAELFVSSWRGPTIALVHLATLGFISMTLIVAFHRELDRHPCRRRPGTFGIGLSYVSLVLGVAALGWGMARGESDFVFFAVGALGIMVLALLIPGVRALRGLDAPLRERRALETALASFFVVASLGVWVAHGHGGMRFPGPRPMWIQVHICVGLLGWVGGLICARIQHVDASPEVAEGRRDDLLLRVGLFVPVCVLFAQYFGLLGASAGRLAAFSALPALFVIWWALPVRVLLDRPPSSVQGGTPERLGLALGPLCLVLGVFAYWLVEPRLVLAFGWIAVWGWAGLCVHGLLLELAADWRRGPQASIAGADRGHALRVATGLHLASLLTGLVAIALGDDVVARLTGALLVATGCGLYAQLAALLSGDQQGETGSVRSSA